MIILGKIITATHKFIDDLDKTSTIKNLTYYKQKLEKNNEILTLVSLYNKETEDIKKLNIKKQLYENNDYKNYMKYYNELFYIILSINKQYQKYTNTKEHNCHG